MAISPAESRGTADRAFQYMQSHKLSLLPNRFLGHRQPAVPLPVPRPRRICRGLEDRKPFIVLTVKR